MNDFNYQDDIKKYIHNVIHYVFPNDCYDDMWDFERSIGGKKKYFLSLLSFKVFRNLEIGNFFLSIDITLKIRNFIFLFLKSKNYHF